MTDRGVVAHEPSLGRVSRVGSWDELARGTFRTAAAACEDGRWEDAAQLVEVSLLEAEELHDVYERWPSATRDWLLGRGVAQVDLTVEEARLAEVIGARAVRGIAAEWPRFAAAVDAAAAACRRGDVGSVAAVEEAREVWQGIHDRAVDHVAGTIDLAVRLAGEDALRDLWDFLMVDWYDLHERRYRPSHQSWEDSSQQLMTAIVDGFHAHLTGGTRSGEIEVIEEPDRRGFRFAPCGSGGRSVDPGITGGRPRSGPPYDFAVTTRPHDWSWNRTGICSYCVHCCLLNELVPIERIGHPTRVIDPPTWPPSASGSSCTWWVYKDPALVPDEVYARVGRTRPAIRDESEDA